MNQTHLAHPAHPARKRRFRRARAAECAGTARVTVTWTFENDLGVPSRAQLAFELASAPSLAELHWLADLAAARCHEVVLTAHVGNDRSAKHRVLELAERLTLELTATQPLVRVLFPAAIPALQ